jgi:hypothetical protein
LLFIDHWGPFEFSKAKLSNHGMIALPGFEISRDPRPFARSVRSADPLEDLSNGSQLLINRPAQSLI